MTPALDSAEMPGEARSRRLGRHPDKEASRSENRELLAAEMINPISVALT